jgi:hypothetical protein
MSSIDLGNRFNFILPGIVPQGPQQMRRAQAGILDRTIYPIRLNSI